MHPKIRINARKCQSVNVYLRTTLGERKSETIAVMRKHAI